MTDDAPFSDLRTYPNSLNHTKCPEASPATTVPSSITAIDVGSA